MNKVDILIVEDESMVALDIQDRLTALGYNVIDKFSSGEDVLKRIDEVKPDLIFMDIKLKGNIDGIETAVKLKEKYDIPIIYLTAYADSQTIKRAKKTQPDGYLVKPFNDNDLFSVIETALYRNKMADKLKKANVEIEKREKYLEAVLNNTPNAIITGDEKQRIVEWNLGAEKMFGYKKEEVTNKYIDDLVAKPKIKDKAENITQRVLKGEHITHEKTVRYRKDGVPIDVIVSASPIKKEGKILGAVGVYTDITRIEQVTNELQKSKEKVVKINKELKKALKRANLMASKAEEANKTKSEFLANMSHEIKTPMNGIIGMTDLVLKTKLTPQQREYLEALKISSESMMIIINDILDFSKIEAGKMELNSVNFELKKIFYDAIKTLEYMIDEKNLKVIMHFSEELPEYIIGDPERLKQVILNLLSNSVKFTEKGGIIIKVNVVKLLPESLLIHCSVTDTGIGISKEQHKKIFDSFTQGDSSLTKRIGGTGLGLTICSSLIEMMGGKIWLQSPVKKREIKEGGEGSVFHFTARFGHKKEKLGGKNTIKSKHEKIEVKNMNKKNGIMPFPEKSSKVLLAEDNIINRKLAESLLKKRGFNVISVENGKEVLQYLEKEYFDLILMDVQMPEMDGLMTTQEIRKLEETTGEHIPIIAMTAHAMQGDKEKCIDAGMDDYIPKPIRASEFWKVISSALRESISNNQKENDIDIDINRAMETVEGDKELFQQLIEDFLNLLPKQLSGIGEVIKKGDTEQLQKRAHSFKGAVANFGADTAYELAYKLENLGKNDKLENASEVFRKLKDEMGHVRDYFTDNKWVKHVL